MRKWSSDLLTTQWMGCLSVNSGRLLLAFYRLENSGPGVESWTQLKERDTIVIFKTFIE